MNYYDIMLARNLANKGDPIIEGLSVTENGTYSEEGKAYKPVVVNVPLPSNAYLLKRASGDVVNISDGAEFNLVTCDVDLELVQSGSGDPSPENIRAISEYSSVVITQKDSDTNPTQTKTYTTQLGETVCKGILKLTNGEFITDKGIEAIPSINALSTSGGHKYTSFSPTGIANTGGATSKDDLISDRLSFVSTLGNYFGMYHIAGNVVICVPDDYTVEEYNANIAGGKIAYPLSATKTIDLTPTQIKLLENNNVIYADSGDIAIEYFGKGVRA